MSTSAVQYTDRGFWCGDVLLQIFASLLAEDLQESCNQAWVDEYATHLHEQSTTSLVGCVNLNLSQIPECGRHCLTDSIHRIAKKVVEDPGLMSANRLNKMGIGGVGDFQRDVEPCKIKPLCVALSELLQGNWKWKTSDAEALPGYWEKLYGTRTP